MMRSDELLKSIQCGDFTKIVPKLTEYFSVIQNNDQHLTQSQLKDYNTFVFRFLHAIVSIKQPPTDVSDVKNLLQACIQCGELYVRIQRQTGIDKQYGIQKLIYHILTKYKGKEYLDDIFKLSELLYQMFCGDGSDAAGKIIKAVYSLLWNVVVKIANRDLSEDVILRSQVFKLLGICLKFITLLNSTTLLLDRLKDIAVLYRHTGSNNANNNVINYEKYSIENIETELENEDVILRSQVFNLLGVCLRFITLLNSTTLLLERLKDIAVFYRHTDSNNANNKSKTENSHSEMCQVLDDVNAWLKNGEHEDINQGNRHSDRENGEKSKDKTPETVLHIQCLLTSWYIKMSMYEKAQEMLTDINETHCKSLESTSSIFQNLFTSIILIDQTMKGVGKTVGKNSLDECVDNLDHVNSALKPSIYENSNDLWTLHRCLYTILQLMNKEFFQHFKGQFTWTNIQILLNSCDVFADICTCSIKQLLSDGKKCQTSEKLEGKKEGKSDNVKSDSAELDKRTQDYFGKLHRDRLTVHYKKLELLYNLLQELSDIGNEDEILDLIVEIASKYTELLTEDSSRISDKELQMEKKQISYISLALGKFLYSKELYAHAGPLYKITGYHLQQSDQAKAFQVFECYVDCFCEQKMFYEATHFILELVEIGTEAVLPAVTMWTKVKENAISHEETHFTSMTFHGLLEKTGITLSDYTARDLLVMEYKNWRKSSQVNLEVEFILLTKMQEVCTGPEHEAEVLIELSSNLFLTGNMHEDRSPGEMLNRAIVLLDKCKGNTLLTSALAHYRKYLVNHQELIERCCPESLFEKDKKSQETSTESDGQNKPGNSKDFKYVTPFSLEIEQSNLPYLLKVIKLWECGFEGKQGPVSSKKSKTSVEMYDLEIHLDTMISCGARLIAMKQPSYALKVLKTASGQLKNITDKKQATELRMKTSQALMLLGQFDQSEQMIGPLDMETDPLNLDKMLLMAELFLRMGKKQATELRMKTSQALMLLGQFDQSEQMIGPLDMETDPLNLDKMLLMAELFLRMGKNITDKKQATELRMKTSQALMLLGQFDQSEQMIGPLDMEADPLNLDKMLLMAELFLRMGKIEDGMSLVNKVLQVKKSGVMSSKSGLRNGTAKRLLSMYLCCPEGHKMMRGKHDILTLAAEAVGQHLGVLKHEIKTKAKSKIQDKRWVLMFEFFQSLLHLCQLYRYTGLAMIAEVFQNQGIRMSQQEGLPLWSCEFIFEALRTHSMGVDSIRTIAAVKSIKSILDTNGLKDNGLTTIPKHTNGLKGKDLASIPKHKGLSLTHFDAKSSSSETETLIDVDAMNEVVDISEGTSNPEEDIQHELDSAEREELCKLTVPECRCVKEKSTCECDMSVHRLYVTAGIVISDFLTQFEMGSARNRILSELLTKYPQYFNSFENKQSNGMQVTSKNMDPQFKFLCLEAMCIQAESLLGERKFDQVQEIWSGLQDMERRGFWSNVIHSDVLMSRVALCQASSFMFSVQTDTNTTLPCQPVDIKSSEGLLSSSKKVCFSDLVSSIPDESRNIMKTDIDTENVDPNKKVLNNKKKSLCDSRTPFTPLKSHTQDRTESSGTMMGKLMLSAKKQKLTQVLGTPLTCRKTKLDFLMESDNEGDIVFPASKPVTPKCVMKSDRKKRVKSRKGLNSVDETSVGDSKRSGSITDDLNDIKVPLMNKVDLVLDSDKLNSTNNEDATIEKLPKSKQKGRRKKSDIESEQIKQTTEIPTSKVLDIDKTVAADSEKNTETSVIEDKKNAKVSKTSRQTKIPRSKKESVKINDKKKEIVPEYQNDNTVEAEKTENKMTEEIVTTSSQNSIKSNSKTGKEKLLSKGKRKGKTDDNLECKEPLNNPAVLQNKGDVFDFDFTPEKTQTSKTSKVKTGKTARKTSKKDDSQPTKEVKPVSKPVKKVSETKTCKPSVRGGQRLRTDVETVRGRAGDDTETNTWNLSYSYNHIDNSGELGYIHIDGELDIVNSDVNIADSSDDSFITELDEFHCELYSPEPFTSPQNYLSIVNIPQDELVTLDTKEFDEIEIMRGGTRQTRKTVKNPDKERAKEESDSKEKVNSKISEKQTDALDKRTNKAGRQSKAELNKRTEIAPKQPTTRKTDKENAKGKPDDIEKVTSDKSEKQKDELTKKTKIRSSQPPKRKLSEVEVVRSGDSVNMRTLMERMSLDCNIAAVDENATIAMKENQAAQEAKMMDLLEDLQGRIRHFAPYPQYPQMCQVLASKYVNSNPRKAAYLLSESIAVSFRHHAAVVRNSSKDSGQSTRMSRGSGFHEKARLSTNHTVNKDEDELLAMIDSIPTDWCVVQMSVTSDLLQQQHFLLTRLAKGKEPLIIEIPAFSTSQGRDVLKDFEMLHDQNQGLKQVTDKSEWWKQRMHIDNRLKDIINTMEEFWLGPWKGIFMPPLNDDSLISSLQNNIKKAVKIEIDTSKLELILISKSILSDNQLRSCVRTLCGPLLKEQDIDSVMSIVSKCTLPDIEISSQHHTVLILDKEQDIDSVMSIVNKCTVQDIEISSQHHVVLILDKNVQHLPWECLPVLSERSVSRMPCLSHLYYQLSHLTAQESSVFVKGANPKSLFYIVNPDGDLANTEETFKDWFKSEEGWEGICGTKPTKEQFSQALTEKDIMVYLGHGSGGRYFSGHEIEKLQGRAVTVLMGCSSGKLQVRGQLEGFGIMISYFVAGCPCMVANLWDVTDKDIDKYTMELLKTWLKADDGSNLIPYVQKARKACKMKYLVGSAPVVYGLPVFINRGGS